MKPYRMSHARMGFAVPKFVFGSQGQGEIGCPDVIADTVANPDGTRMVEVDWTIMAARNLLRSREHRIWHAQGALECGETN